MDKRRFGQLMALLLSLILVAVCLPALAATMNDDMETEAYSEGVALRWGYVSAKGGVNLRKKASTSSSLADKLKNKTMVFVYDAETNTKDELWFIVENDGKKVYVMAKYIVLLTADDSNRYNDSLSSPMPTPTLAPTLAPTATPTTAPTTAPTTTPTTTPTTAPTTAPTQAQTTAPTLEPDWYYENAVPEEDDNVIATEEDTLTDDQVYAILENYSTNYDPNSVKETAVTEPPITMDAELLVEAYAVAAKTAQEGVPVRNNPDPYAGVTATLAKDTVVRVSAKVTNKQDTQWLAVSYGAQWGYIRADKVTVLSANEQAAYADALAQSTVAPGSYDSTRASLYGTVASATLLMRAAPDAASAQVARLTKGTAVVWLQSFQKDDVLYAGILVNGQTGYINAKYINTLTLAELYKSLSEGKAQEVLQTGLPED